MNSNGELTYIFIFTLLCDDSEGFIMAFKTFVKHFENKYLR